MSLLIEPLMTIANVSTVLLSAFAKVPQIMSILRSRSVVGVSRSSIMLELTGYCITMSYFISYQYALSGYLEYPFLVLQDLVLLATVLWLSSDGNPVLMMGYAGLLLALISSMIGGLLSAPMMTMLVSSSTPISAISKVVQLMAIIRRQSSEGVALTSWVISTYTCLTRLATIYIATADVALMMNFAISVVLNSCIVVAVIVYTPPAAAAASAIAASKSKKRRTK
uniref:PQ-loop repeat-containing protein 3-like n=1 Tax=Hirondellea gigas TaxID=1518452 RepID=A0A2P2I906_9CRUS